MFINVCLKERIMSDSSVLGKKQNIKMADTAEGVLYDPVRVEFESKQNYPPSRGKRTVESWGSAGREGAPRELA